MTDSPRKGSKAAQRREEILDAALVCFREKGFHAASMSSIARAFGMSAGHIYNYFDSKEAIIAALVDRWVEEYVKKPPFPIELDAHLQYEKMLESVKSELSENIDGCDKALLFEIAAESLRNEKIAESIRRANAKARSFIRMNVLKRYEKHGRKPPEDLDARIAICSSIFDGVCFRSIADRTMSAETLAPVLTRILMYVEDMPEATKPLVGSGKN